MDRRSFLKGEAAFLLGSLFVANWGTPAQIRQYKQAGKPLLTEANLNRFFEEARSRGDLSRHARQGRADVSGFLHANFSLSPQQETTLANLTLAQRAQLGELLSHAEEPGAALNFKFVNSARCQTQVSVTSAGVAKTLVL